MSNYIISGIQQIGIGIPNVQEAFAWYRKNFGMDIKVFEEAATAELMLPYTDNKPQARHAILAANLQGGGGFEIWQYTGRTPQPATFEIQLGDYGFFATKMKSTNVDKAYANFKSKGLNVLSEVLQDPSGRKHFFVKDVYNNVFQVVEYNVVFKEENKSTGGPVGCIIGVSDIEKSRTLYSDVLGYDTVVYDKTGQFDDLQSLSGGNGKFRRVLLKHSEPRKGAFSNLIGPTEMELVVALDRKPQKIYENRLWGDLGFIHLCFDIQGMKELQKKCESKGYPFTVDSSDSFDMGAAAGHFSYVEDPDGALIEFVETHKLPVLPKFGISLNLRNRNPEKPLYNWMIKAMKFNRVKD